MAATEQGRWIITSPNMPSIPHFPVDAVTVKIRSDGRFGEEDFTLCPQVFCKQYAHRMVVRRYPGDDAIESVMWWTPVSDNFETLPGSSYTDLGRLRSGQLKTIDAMTWNLRNRAYDIIAQNPHGDWVTLEGVIAHMRYGVMRLKYSPYTFREMVMDVAQTQRLYLDALALCDYIQDDWPTRFLTLGPPPKRTRSEFVGAWTADPSVVQQLHHAGIPVYFVRISVGVGDLERRAWRFQPALRIGLATTGDWCMPERYGGMPNTKLHSATSSINDYGDLERYYYDMDRQGTVQPVGERGKMTLYIVAQPPGRSKTRRKKNTGATICPPIGVDQNIH